MDWNLIPQVFYDLISRVIPGLVAILVWYLAALGPLEGVRRALDALSSKDSQVLNLWSSMIAFVLAYLLGFILEGFWSLTWGNLDRTTKRQKNESRWTADSIGEYNRLRASLNAQPLALASGTLPPSYTMLDQLRHKRPAEANRLLKLRAESRLCERTFLVASLAVLSLTALMLINPGWRTFDRAVMLFLSGVATFCFWPLRLKFDRFYTMGVCTAWLLVNFPVGASETAQADQPPSD